VQVMEGNSLPPPPKAARAPTAAQEPCATMPASAPTPQAQKLPIAPIAAADEVIE
jgi:hypothetical protein